MTVFDAYNEGNKDPHYDFREPDGRKANTFWGDFAKGGAKLLDEGLKGIDAATKSTLDDETSGYVNTLRNQNIREYQEATGNILAATSGLPGTGSQTATGAPTGPSANSTVSDPSQITNSPMASPRAPGGIPGPISSELRVVDKMNEGWRQGHFDSERFFGEVQARTANLVSRYPGYADYIQSKVTHYLGTDPANAQREHLQQTIRQLLGGTDKAQTAIEKWNHEVMSNYAAPMGAEWTKAALAAGADHSAQQQFRVQAADRLNFDYGQKRDKETFELRTLQGTATQNDAIHQASLYFDGEHSRMLSTSTMAASGWTGKMQDVHNNLAAQRLNGTPDLEQNKAMALAVGGLQAGWDANFESEWVRPRFGKDPKTGMPVESFSSLIKDPSMKEQFKKKYSTVFESLRSQVGSGQFDLATVVSDLSARKLDGAIAGLYTNDAVLALNAGSKAFGQSFDTIYGSANLRSNMELNNSLSQTFLKAALGKTMATGAANGNSLLEAAQKLKAQMAANPLTATQNLPPKFLETLMTNLTTVITHPSKDVSTEVKFNAVEVLSNPATPGFLNLITPEQQFKAYGVLYGADVSDHIKGFKATEVWNRYKQSAGESFNTIFGVFANDVQKYIKQDYKGTFAWNEKTQQIDYTTERTTSLANDRNKNPVSNAVDRLNQGLRVYSDILKKDGEVITPQVLQGLGIDVNKASENVNLEKMLKTLRNIPVQTTAAEKTSAEGPAPMNVRGLTSKTPPAAIVRDKGPTLSNLPKGDEGNDNSRPTIRDIHALQGFNKVTEDFINEHMSRPLFINGTPVVEEERKRNILRDVIKTKEGKYYWNRDGRLVPINL